MKSACYSVSTESWPDYLYSASRLASPGSFFSRGSLEPILWNRLIRGTRHTLACFLSIGPVFKNPSLRGICVCVTRSTANPRCPRCPQLPLIPQTHTNVTSHMGCVEPFVHSAKCGPMARQTFGCWLAISKFLVILAAHICGPVGASVVSSIRSTQMNIDKYLQIRQVEY